MATEKPLTAADLREIAAEIIAAVKQPSPAEVARANSLERAKQQTRQMVAEQERVRRERQTSCEHKREDGTSAIAWATQSDGATRGVCQHCNRLIVPNDADYEQLRAMPVKSLLQEIAR